VRPIKQAIPTYGRELIAEVERAYFDDCLVICAPEAWQLVKHEFAHPPKEIAVPQSMEQSRLERQLRRLPQCETVFGVGGGSACDAAKHFAHLHGARLILAPSAISVDAPFTKAVGLRVNGRVRYVGEVFPDLLLLDFDILEKAPPRLSRAGVGDILSIHTALADWRLAAREQGEAFDETIAAESQGLLDRLLAGAADLREGNEAGLRLLAELCVGEVRLCEQWGNSRPEEGSEHYLAYCVEWLTKRHFLHGELVVLGVLLAALHQDQPVAPILAFLREVGVQFQPEQVGLGRDELRRALLALPRYLAEERQLLYGSYHQRGVTEVAADELLAKLRAACEFV
jgi:glycerol-1-phosphate dehydrogenase [NAD(P)+]